MRRELLTMLLLLTLPLAGCTVTGEVEKQAYVLALGLDAAEDGIMVSVRIPSIGTSKAREDSGTKGGEYLTCSAVGSSFSDALEALRQRTPRPLNLSHIGVIAVSAALARSERFPSIMNEAAETRTLYTSARPVVCEGAARDFVNAQRPTIGTRLSADMNAAFETSAERGYVPRVTFGDLYYASNSLYADPVAALAWVRDSDDSPAPIAYQGSVVFAGGCAVLTLDARQTQVFNLIRGQRVTLQREAGGVPVTLDAHSMPEIDVRLHGDVPFIQLKLRLTVQGALSEEAREQLEADLEDEITRLIAQCQTSGVEPFGFSERAAARFPTYQAWLDYDWRTRFHIASVIVEVRVFTN